MKKNLKTLFVGLSLIIYFVIWTILVVKIDVQPIGLNNTNVGFANLNSRFHDFTGVNFQIYNLTDWLGLIPIFICLAFAILGLVQIIKRKSIFKVDLDIILLGVYYILVIFFYLIFEVVPINYRPTFINGFMEASYPSSTTLLVLSVMPTLSFQISRRLQSRIINKIVNVFVIVFSAFMVIGRLISGVHWLTDIIGSIFLSYGLFFIYKGVVLLVNKSDKETL